MERAFGLPAMADHYAAISDRIKATADSKYWDASRGGLYADTSRRGSYSQHVNALAVLSGVARGERAGQVMAAALEDGRLIKTTIYFSYYLNRALKKSRAGRPAAGQSRRLGGAVETRADDLGRNARNRRVPTATPGDRVPTSNFTAPYWASTATPPGFRKIGSNRRWAT